MNDDPRDALAKNIFGDDEAGPARQMRQYVFEERVIKRVFTESGVRPRGGWGYFVNQSREIIGVPKLSFQWFNKVFRFPGVLCGARMAHMHELTLQDMVKPPQRNKMFKRVAKQLYKRDIDTARQKFVFCFPVVRTLFCAHNLRSQASDSWDKPTWRWQISTTLNGEGCEEWMFIEPLSGFCQGLPASEWFDA